MPPNAGAPSSTRTVRPRRARASAVVSPPSPPPTMRIGSLAMASRWALGAHQGITFIRKLFALEICRAFLIECQNAFAAVFGRDHPVIRFGLERETIPKRHVHATADGKLGLPHPDRRVARDGLGRGERPAEGPRSRQHLADPPPPLRSRRGKRLAR